MRNWRWTDWQSSSLGLSHAYRGPELQTEEVVYASLFANTLDSYDNATYTTQLLPVSFHSVYEDTSFGGFGRTTSIVPLDAGRTLRVKTWTGVKHDNHTSTATLGAPTVHVSTNILTTSAEADLELIPPWLRAASGVQIDAEIPDTPPSGPKPNASAAVGPLATLSLVPSRVWSVAFSVASRTRFPTLHDLSRRATSSPRGLEQSQGA